MLFEKNKIELIEGFGSVTDDANVKIGGQFDGTEIKTDRVILATGSVAKPSCSTFSSASASSTPPGCGCWTSSPRGCASIGAGASGVEIAPRSGAWAPRWCCSRRSTRSFAGGRGDLQGVRAGDQEAERTHRNRSEGEGAEASDSGVLVSFNGESADFDYLVIAAGRAPDVEGLESRRRRGSSATIAGLIKVDGRLRTSLDGVWAIGDMVPGPASPTRPRRGHHRRGGRRRQRGHESTTRTSPRSPSAIRRWPRSGGQRPPATLATTWWWARSRWAPWERRRSTTTAAVWEDRGDGCTARSWAHILLGSAVTSSRSWRTRASASRGGSHPDRMPGEITRAHRHSPSALRFIVEGDRGLYGGER